MKNFFCILTALFIVTYGNSQNAFNQWTVSAGASHNIFRGLYKLSFSSYEKNFTPTVGRQAHVDWGLFRLFSIGLGAAHQTHHLRIHDYTYEHKDKLFIENPTQSIYSTSVYIRALIHPRKISQNTNEKIDFYFGIQNKLIYVRTEDNSQDPDFPVRNDLLHPVPVSLCGLRYYPTEKFGIYGELAVPGNYNCSLGISLRLN